MVTQNEANISWARESKIPKGSMGWEDLPQAYIGSPCELVTELMVGK